ncbi:MAG: hypothetical protein A2V98_16280 [Planctomycetes bacterium RBG_16_64_12]|nr:MAG: hypothetical protein A2V98_16280 [Planctomycetes bacterium RBG_16_64_12]
MSKVLGAVVELQWRQPACYVLAFEARQGEWASPLDGISFVCGVASASANGRLVKFHDRNHL